MQNEIGHCIVGYNVQHSVIEKNQVLHYIFFVVVVEYPIKLGNTWSYPSKIGCEHHFMLA